MEQPQAHTWTPERICSKFGLTLSSLINNCQFNFWKIVKNTKSLQFFCSTHKIQKKLIDHCGGFFYKMHINNETEFVSRFHFP